MARDLISDAEWAFFEPFIRAVRQPNGRKPFDHRRVLDGVFWIARTGAPWRNLHEEFGKWGSVFHQFRRWTLAVLWQTILEVLSTEQRTDDPLTGRRLRSIRREVTTPLSGRTIRRLAQKGDPGASSWALFGVVLRKRLSGEGSRGGFTTKIHLLTNGSGLPMKAEINCGQVSDYRGYDAVMEDDLPQPKVLMADRG